MSARWLNPYTPSNWLGELPRLPKYPSIQVLNNPSWVQVDRLGCHAYLPTLGYPLPQAQSHSNVALFTAPVTLECKGSCPCCVDVFACHTLKLYNLEILVHGTVEQQCRRNFNSTTMATLVSNFEGLIDLLFLRYSAPFQLALGYGDGMSLCALASISPSRPTLQTLPS
jgi:hypothetical protein